MISVIQHTWQTKIQHTSAKDKTQEGERLAQEIFLAKNDGPRIKELRSMPIFNIRPATTRFLQCYSYRFVVIVVRKDKNFHQVQFASKVLAYEEQQ